MSLIGIINSLFTYILLKPKFTSFKYRFLNYPSHKWFYCHLEYFIHSWEIIGFGYFSSNGIIYIKYWKIIFKINYHCNCYDERESVLFIRWAELSKRRVRLRNAKQFNKNENKILCVSCVAEHRGESSQPCWPLTPATITRGFSLGFIQTATTTYLAKANSTVNKSWKYKPNISKWKQPNPRKKGMEILFI